MTCHNGVVVCGDDFLETVFRDDDFVVCPQSAVLEVLTFVVLELPGCLIAGVGENLGVLTVVLYPVVENGVGWGNEASDDVVDWEDGSKEFLGLAVLVHPAQNVGYDVRLPGDMVNGKIELLESVQPSNLAGGRFCHGLEVLQRGAVGVYNDW